MEKIKTRKSIEQQVQDAETVLAQARKIVHHTRQHGGKMRFHLEALCDGLARALAIYDEKYRRKE